MVILPTVLYVPTLKLSLFSLSPVEKSGAIVTFAPDVGAQVKKNEALIT